MRRFLKTIFFARLEESLQKGTEVTESNLSEEYDRFAVFLFEETEQNCDSLTFRQILCYTRVELSVMESKGRIEKKTVQLFYT
jgi:hypothetical protein